MVKPRLSLAVCVYLITVAAAFAQTSYVFELPGKTGLTKQIVGKGDDNFGRLVSAANGPSGAFNVVATPTGSKFYILAPSGIFSANSTLSSISPIGSISGTPTTAQVTPDGKYLLVVADHFYIVDTSNDSLAAQADTGILSQSTAVGFAVSHDAKTAWIVSNTNTGSIVTVLNLTTLQSSTTFVRLPVTAASVVLSSRNLLYVAANGGVVYEVDPTSLTITTSGSIQVPNGLPGPLQFTPDGSAAYFLNRNTCSSCPPIFKLDVAAHAISSWLPVDSTATPALDQVLVAGNNRIFAVSSATTQLWDVTPTPFAVTKSVLNTLPTGDVKAAAISGERPSARYLYLSISDLSFYRVNLATNAVNGTSTLDPVSFTILSFVPIPAPSGASSLFQINPSLTVAPGGTATLIAQVLDSVGRPVFGVPASFTPKSCSGATIATPSMVTAAEGFAQTAVTAPPTSGSCTITLTAGSLTADFQINVGSGTVTGVPQISIYSGDGQLLRQNESTLSTQQPLTVKVTDANGSPLAGVSVGFANTAGIGGVVSSSVVTGQDGLASSDYTSGALDPGFHFELSQITATSTYGSVVFYEMTEESKVNDLYAPNALINAPVNQRITIPEGGFISGAIKVLTYSEHTAGPIPNVGLRIADAANIYANSTVASCVGLSRGDASGVSSCDLQAACQPTGGLPRDFGAVIQVGEFKQISLIVNVTKAAAALITPISSTNLAGNPSDSFVLTARVTDGCLTPSANLSGLSWTVQGPATLSQVQTISDSSGQVSARVTLGQTAGAVQVQLSGPGLAPLVFKLSIQVPATSISVVPPLPQPVIVGQAFQGPVTFVVRGATNNPVPGIVVNFSATLGATVNPASATSDAQGRVQTNVTAGATPGTIVVTAASSSLSASANLSAHLAVPLITSTSFVNAASQAAGMTPCGLVTVTGSGMAPTITGVISGLNAFGPMPYTLAQVSISVQQGANSYPAPIQAVANQNGVQQVNFQAPCELTAGTASAIVTVNGATITVPGVPVLAAQPGIFAWTGPNNKLYGAVIRAADGSYVTPSNPAHRGDLLYLIVTGLGQGTPAILTNASGTGTQDVNAPIIMGVSDGGVPVKFARYLIGSIGAYLVEFQIPADSPIGPDQSLAIAYYDGTNYHFGNPVYLPGVLP